MSEESSAREEVVALMREMEKRPVHVEHVARLALQLFDGLASLHGLGPRERLLLEAAGLLHDIGHRVESSGHHLASAGLIRQHPWKGFLPMEVEVIAQVARYHRKTMPELDQEEFRALPEVERRLVQRLAALLRLADALDRSHAQVVQRLTVDLFPNQIVIHLDVSGPILREVRSAQSKGDLAIAVFQRDLVFMVDGDEIQPPLGPEI